MMHTTMRSTVVFMALVSCACSTTVGVVPPEDAGAVDATLGADAAPAGPAVEDELARLLTGRFDSKDQAAQDKTYLEITLEICKIDAPELGPRVLYVEQARPPSAPYRQRLYVIDRKDSTTAVSRVFELRTPKTWIGACADAKPRSAVPADAEEKVGCGVEMHLIEKGKLQGATSDLKWNGSSFAKDPSGLKCPSDLNGASYASSTVTLTETELLSWDRGFTTEEKQVWGATAGGYRFIRRP
jgi:CpeT protein